MTSGGERWYRRHYFRRILKPWYVRRPWQLARRIKGVWSSPASEYVPQPVAWGVSLLTDPAKLIGRSIRETGVYDLTVSEALARLIDRGDTVIDAGANVGYMTALAAIAAGSDGRVFAWEPHPELFAILQRNIHRIARTTTCARVTVRRRALGDIAGPVQLVVPAAIRLNDGLSHIGGPAPCDDVIPVCMETLDEIVGGRRISVMKLDVEGAEERVLRGAMQALMRRQISHVVFEDHHAEDSNVIRLLTSVGYRVFSLGWSIRGLCLGDWRRRLATDYEAPNYVATLDQDELHARCVAPGWLTLSSRYVRHTSRNSQRTTVATWDTCS